jgi:hypothetical protein
MFKFVIDRFGLPGAISVVALIFAMAGGAYAAKKYVITSTSQIKPSVLRSLKGSPGVPGAGGTTGDTGAPGAPGSPGANGNDGTNGLSGRGVSLSAISEGESECAEVGGARVTEQGSSSGVELCNGKEGSPWTAGGTLPKRATETGVWVLGPITAGMIPGEPLGSPAMVPISFSIPLASPLSPEHVHYINAAGKEVVNFTEEIDSTDCLGSAAQATAGPGNLCVYAAHEEESSAVFMSGIVDPSQEPGAFGASAYGAAVQFILTAPGTKITGTWAVTGNEVTP